MSAFWGLLIAVFAVSWASIFIRWCGDTPALVISFYRMFWSTLLLFVYQMLKNRSAFTLGSLTVRQRWMLTAAGVLLALHFATWIASIQMTLISHSLILESTHPVLALLLSPFFLKEKGSWRAVLAAVFTLAGIVVIAGQDLHFAGGKLAGDLLALAGALFFTFYVFIARSLRKHIDIIPYLIYVYFAATAVLFLLLIVSSTPPINYPLRVHGFMLLLALIPTGIGHSLINWAARKIEAYKVNFSVLGEPVFASVLAFFIFAEEPYGWFYFGALFILVGIVLALVDQTTSPVTGQTTA